MLPIVCTACGKRFVAQSARRKKCDECRISSTHHAEKGPLEFIGVDGEGVTRPDGTHEYVLLSVGNKSLYKSDGSVLTWYDIVPFLWECFLDKPEAIYVGFYLGYDFTHWVRHLPEDRARILLTSEGIASRQRSKSGGNHLPFPVGHGPWHFDFLGFKRFRLWQKESVSRMYICDTGSYFQTSFLNAIDPVKWPDGPIVSDDEYKLIQEGKSDRGRGVVEYGTPIDPDMIRYNVLENEVLGRLMLRYSEGLANVGIKLKRNQWFGPGQAAQVWMSNIKAPTRDEFENATSLGIRNALRSSYYGGWFEITAHGHIPGTSYSYDINSAYPDIQSRLPCVIHGRWEEISSHSRSESEYTLFYGTAEGSNSYLGATPHRLRTGHILRPQISRGWYWKHEIDAAKKCNIIDSFSVERGMAYFPCDCPFPFSAERRLYQDRLRVGKNTIAGKARKLVYNSAYGKTAQSIGLAKYANPFYASLITSLCRTYILNAIAVHPYGASDVLMVATDGIYFRHRNPNLALSEETLGQWSEEKHSNLLLFMPGVYWDDRTRIKLKEGQHPSLKSRGIPASALSSRITEIDDLFNDPFSGKGFPTFELPISFNLTSPKQALARNKWDTCGHVETGGIRRIDSDPYMKRNPVVFLENGILRSHCYPQGVTGIDTTPYNKTFGDEELRELQTLLGPDGDMEMLIADALKGNE